MSEPFVSIIIPVRNEERRLGNCPRSIEDLDYPKDRIKAIIADGLSADSTPGVAAAPGATVIENTGQTVSPGRNRAFAAARGNLIAFTDAECIVDRKWPVNALKYFTEVFPEVGCSDC